MSLDSEKSTQTVLLKTKEAAGNNLSKENSDNLFKESLDNNTGIHKFWCRGSKT